MPEKTELYGLYVYYVMYVVQFGNFGMLRVKGAVVWLSGYDH